VEAGEAANLPPTLPQAHWHLQAAAAAAAVTVAAAGRPIALCRAAMSALCRCTPNVVFLQ